jgi:hypothetical protein
VGFSRCKSYRSYLNGQPGVLDFKAGSMGEDLSAPSEPGYFSPVTAALVVHVEQKKSPQVTAGDRFLAWLVIDKMAETYTRGTELSNSCSNFTHLYLTGLALLSLCSYLLTELMRSLEFSTVAVFEYFVLKETFQRLPSDVEGREI